MIKIAVLTNRQVYRNQIKEITERSLSLLSISYELKEYTRLQDLFDDLSEHEGYDIFLLDTEMSDYSCFEIAHRIKIEKIDSKIIYITNQVEYAPGAYEVNPYRYIPQKLLGTMLPKAYKTFCEQIKKRKKETLYFTPDNSASSERISYREIYYLKRKGKSTLIVHKNGQFKVEKTFPEVLKEFIRTPCFSLISKNCAVNILHVMSFEGQKIHLREGSILSIDEKNKEQFLKDILNYIHFST